MTFKKSDIKDLADKLKELCDNEAVVNELKSGAGEFILGKYNWKDIAAATHELYKKVLKK